MGDCANDNTKRVMFDCKAPTLQRAKNANGKPTPGLMNIYEHYVENFSNKSLLNKATVYKFDKLCQNTIVQNGQLRRHNTET